MKIRAKVIKKTNTNKLNYKIMKQTIITEQKKVRLSIIKDNAGTNYSVETQDYKGNWYTRNKFKSTANGFEKALLLYYRLILCEVDANIIMDIDNDLYINL